MSSAKREISATGHAMLVAWGLFAKQIGLLAALDEVELHQKKYRHSPLRKIKEFFVAILAGLPHLDDLSKSARPIAKDKAVAVAWGESDWCDHSGVSRALHALTEAEAKSIVVAFEHVFKPFIADEVMKALTQKEVLVLDGDLTGRSVSDTSTTYPNAAFGYMSDEISLGYQAALVSMESPTHNRLWLSVKPLSGDRVSCTTAREMVYAAEASTGICPNRRPELIAFKIEAKSQELKCAQERYDSLHDKYYSLIGKHQDVKAKLESYQALLDALDAEYTSKGRMERPTSKLAQTRKKVRTYETRLERRQRDIDLIKPRLHNQADKVSQLKASLEALQLYRQQLETDNQNNPQPIRVIFRLDSGFGTSENIAWLLEMGYEIYLKPYAGFLVPHLREQLSDETVWQSVGANAEMTTWPSATLPRIPYPLDVALLRYRFGDSYRYSSMIYFGEDNMVEQLDTWFNTYNARQTIEAGIKEGKNTFQMHHLKVRSEFGLFLQEHFACYAANLIRFATEWFQTQQQPLAAQSPDQMLSLPNSIKAQVTNLAHIPATIDWRENGCLLTFAHGSVYLGKVLRSHEWFFQLPLPLFADFQLEPTDVQPSDDSHSTAAIAQRLIHDAVPRSSVFF